MLTKKCLVVKTRFKFKKDSIFFNKKPSRRESLNNNTLQTTHGIQKESEQHVLLLLLHNTTTTITITSIITITTVAREFCSLSRDVCVSLPKTFPTVLRMRSHFPRQLFHRAVIRVADFRRSLVRELFPDFVHDFSASFALFFGHISHGF